MVARSTAVSTCPFNVFFSGLHSVDSLIWFCNGALVMLDTCSLAPVAQKSVTWHSPPTKPRHPDTLRLC
jgi:hypothetical protein